MAVMEMKKISRLIARDMTTLLSLILGARRHRDARDNFVRDIPKTVHPPKTEAPKIKTRAKLNLALRERRSETKRRARRDNLPAGQNSAGPDAVHIKRGIPASANRGRQAKKRAHLVVHTGKAEI